MYGERTEELIKEVQTKLELSSGAEVLAEVPRFFIIYARLASEKPLGGYLKRWSKSIDEGSHLTQHEILAQQMQQDFDKHTEYKSTINKFISNTSVLQHISTALGISSDPTELGYDEKTGIFDANKAAKAILGAKAPNPDAIEALSSEVKAVVVAGGEVLPESSDAAAGGHNS